MLLVDTKEKIFKRDDILKSEIANLRPVQQWLEEEVGRRGLSWEVGGGGYHGGVGGGRDEGALMGGRRR